MKQVLRNDKQQAHELIDPLTPAQLDALVDLLEAMLDPVSLAIANAPIDAEQLAPGMEKALDQAREWSEHNASTPQEQVLAELGITQEEVDNFKEPK
jgi:hypothetical protein